ncbi:MAG: ABC transporter substrate-binding protein [Candidatus Accumulibacter sp.]|jgi:phospholipid transport system substrate-binding protein|nr:ABC transporter substrate-binding protein [Accumulibacter sp.]
MKFLFSLLLGLILPFSSAFAQEGSSDANSPDAMVKGVTEEVLSIVRQDADIQSGNTGKAIALVEAKVLPHFDFQRMTALAMGRDWNKADPEQKKRLTDEFQTLLVRTYSNALTGYKDQTVRYKPANQPAGDGDTVVKTEILQSGGRPIQLDYSVEKTPDGWKVYDVIVAGVSLVTNYRDAFTQQVRANGVDGLIKMLSDKNRQLESETK